MTESAIPVVPVESTESAGIDFEPVEMHVIDGIEELRVIAHPLRVRILDCLINEAMTVREVEKILRTGSTKLYYHAGELERAGLIRLVHTEIQSGIQLKYYRSIARYFYLSPALLHGNSDEVDASANFVASLLESSARELRRSFSSGCIDRHTDAFVVRHRQNRMSLEVAAEFRRRIEELDEDFRSQSEPEGEVLVELAVALFPRERL